MSFLASPRGYAVTLVGGLASAGAVAVGVSRPWEAATANVAGLPRIEVAVTGADIAPLTGASGVVLLAAFGAVLATRGRVRKAVGLIIVAAALVVLTAALHPGDVTPLLQQRLAAKGWSPGGGYDPASRLWRLLVVAGGAGCLAAGLGVLLAGTSWPTMGRRYDAPEAGAPQATAERSRAPGTELDEEALWRAIDEGRDPTRGP